ncbi:MAG: hypothetical protein A2X49_06065 [Lentisphaerae bacterium GWF2_52_8]|nr:MAG: hypothetical protein A2X49_06065 [Lentisphaerae bacterium GWF2_52_8]
MINLSRYSAIGSDGLLPNGCIPPQVPQYWIVSKDIIKRIHDGDYLPGAKLESIRKLAIRYGVGRQVILSAIHVLSYQNYIYSEPKRGIFVNQRLDVGLYYRIGCFINGANLSQGGDCIFEIYNEARKHNYMTIAGSNFEETFTLGDWLDHKKDIDGVIIGGMVNDEMLSHAQRRQIPYVVLGNYHISPKHPQMTVDVRTLAKKQLLPSFKKFPGKRIAVLLGAAFDRAAAEAAAGFSDAIREAGASFDARLVKPCEGDGFKEVEELLEHEKPDVIYVHGAQRFGLSRYYALHPGAWRPYLIINSEHQQLPEPALCDEEIFCRFLMPENCRKAVSMLMEIIKAKIERQNASRNKPCKEG